MEAMSFLEHIKRVHKRTYIKRIVVIFLVLLFFTVIFLPYFEMVTKPVESVDYNELYDISAGNSQRLYETPVEFENIFTFDTVYMDEEDVITDYYAALLDEDGQFVLAKVPASIYDDTEITTFIGHFADIETDVAEMIIEDLIAVDFTEAEAREIMPDKVFLVDDNRVVFWIVMGALIIGFLILLLLIFKLLSVMNNSSSTSLYKEAAKFGDVDTILNELEQTDIDPAHPNFGITKKFLVLINNKKVNLIPLNQVIWAYEHIYRKKLYFIFTISKIHSLMIGAKDNRYSVVLKKAQIDPALESLRRQMPWIVFGFSNEIENIYKQNRAGFISKVETDRAEKEY